MAKVIPLSYQSPVLSALSDMSVLICREKDWKWSSVSPPLKSFGSAYPRVREREFCDHFLSFSFTAASGIHYHFSSLIISFRSLLRLWEPVSVTYALFPSSSFLSGCFQTFKIDTHFPFYFFPCVKTFKTRAHSAFHSFIFFYFLSFPFVLKYLNRIFIDSTLTLNLSCF